MAAQPTDSEKQKAAERINATTQDQPTTPDSPGTKKTTGTPMEEHPAATRTTSRRRAAPDLREIRFRIEHTQVGAHMQGAEVTQEQLGVDDRGLERLLDLDAVTPVLVDPTASDDDEDDSDEEE